MTIIEHREKILAQLKPMAHLSLYLSERVNYQLSPNLQDKPNPSRRKKETREENDHYYLLFLSF